jgi:hypothetical protein
VGDPLEVDGAGPAHHADDLVALLEQELGQVRAVLAGDAGDERMVNSPGLPILTGIDSSDMTSRYMPSMRSETKQKLRVCDPSPCSVNGSPRKAWQMKLVTTRPSSGRMRGP